MEAFSFKDHFVHTNMSQLMYKRQNVLWLSFKWLRLPQSNHQVGIYIETLGQFQRRYFLSKRKVGSLDLDFWAIVIHCSPKKPSCVYMLTKFITTLSKTYIQRFSKKNLKSYEKKEKGWSFFPFFCQWSILVKPQRPQFSSGSHSEYSLHSCRQRAPFWLLYQQQPVYDRMWP